MHLDKTLNWRNAVLVTILVIVLGYTHVGIQFIYGQITSGGNSTLSNTSIILSVPKKTGAPYQGDSIKLFVVSSLVQEIQWKPIDNYTSHGWDIKAMLPFAKRYIVVLERHEEGNQARP